MTKRTTSATGKAAKCRTATGRQRYSIPQFHHTTFHAVVDPLDLVRGEPANFEPVVAGEFVANGFRRDRKSWA